MFDVSEKNSALFHTIPSPPVSQWVRMSDSDEHWCQSWYERKAAGLVLYGRALGLGHGEAEDVLQETFVALLRMPHPPEDPGNYCVRAFRNRALNHRRSLFRRLTRELEARGWFEGEAAFDPREAAALGALQTLPPDQREAIVLRLWHRMTHDEIGALQGVTANTAAGRYRYGIERLRRHFSGEIPHESERDRNTDGPVEAQEGVPPHWPAAFRPEPGV